MKIEDLPEQGREFTVKYCSDCKRECPDFYKDRKAQRGSGSYCRIHKARRKAQASTKQGLREAIYTLRRQQERAT